MVVTPTEEEELKDSFDFNPVDQNRIGKAPIIA
jgi:hypothetical protein